VTKEIATKKQLEDRFFLDFEASGLGEESYPISVAWGSKASGIKYFVISSLYSPDWNVWCKYSQKIHGMTQDFVNNEGVHPFIVCNAMLDDLRGKKVYSHGAEFDRYWLDVLMAFSGEMIKHDINIFEVVAKDCVQDDILFCKLHDDLEFHNAKNDVIQLINIFAK